MSERSERGPSANPTRESGYLAFGERPRSPAPSNASSTHPREGVEGTTSPASRRPLPPPPEHPGRSFELPPLPPASNIAGGSFPSPIPRVGGVSSILNPVEAEDSNSNLRRKASHLDSPASSTHSRPPISAISHAPSTLNTRAAQSPAAQYGVPSERGGRRMLTPRSPSLHRAASLGQLNASAGTISAQPASFTSSPRSRPYTIEPGTSGAPPLPTPPAGARIGYGFPAPTPPAEAARRASAGAARSRGISSSASPTTSYSSYSQAGQTSPAAQYESAPPTTGPPSFSNGGDNFSGLNTTSIRDHQRQLGIPISSSGSQNVYQMLTLETTAGTVQLPVDVQAASRVADEKRRRNAGASARFRQRRKEKEKEAVTSISRLEQQVKELSEDAAFYRNERDALTGILRQIPGGDRYFPRPPSPRRRRLSAAHPARQSSSDGAGYGPNLEQGPRSPREGRNVRRRTSTYSLPPPPTPMPPPPGVALQPSFGALGPHPPLSSGLQSPMGPLPSPHGRGPLPPPSQIVPGPGPGPQHQPHGPPAVLHALPQTGPYNPYAPPERRSSGPSGPPRDG